MNNKLLLTIAVTSLASASAVAMAQTHDADKSSHETPTTATSTPVSAPKAGASHGGKCSSGKCGTEKIYGKAQIKHDPNGYLVRARDGKCGPSGKGYDATQSTRDKLAQGVCGQ